MTRRNAQCWKAALWDVSLRVRFLRLRVASEYEPASTRMIVKSPRGRLGVSFLRFCSVAQNRGREADSCCAYVRAHARRMASWPYSAGSAARNFDCICTAIPHYSGFDFCLLLVIQWARRHDSYLVGKRHVVRIEPCSPSLRPPGLLCGSRLQERYAG